MNNKNIYLTPRDDLMLKVTSKSGSVSYKFLKDTLKYDRGRINKLVDCGYLVEHNNPIKGGKRGKQILNRFSYSLGLNSVDYCKANGYINAHGGHNGAEHAEIAGDWVYELLTKQNVDINNIKNEKELELIFSKEISNANHKGIDFSVCDLAVIDKHGAITIYEVETSNYRADHRKKHKAFAFDVAKVKKSNYIIKK